MNEDDSSSGKSQENVNFNRRKELIPFMYSSIAKLIQEGMLYQNEPPATLENSDGVSHTPCYKIEHRVATLWPLSHNSSGVPLAPDT